MSKLLTIDEAAVRLAVKPQTLREWVREGRIAAVDLGEGAGRATWRIGEADLDAWIAERRAKAEPA